MWSWKKMLLVAIGLDILDSDRKTPEERRRKYTKDQIQRKKDAKPTKRIRVKRVIIKKQHGKQKTSFGRNNRQDVRIKKQRY